MPYAYWYRVSARLVVVLRQVFVRSLGRVRAGSVVAQCLCCVVVVASAVDADSCRKCPVVVLALCAGMVRLHVISVKFYFEKLVSVLVLAWITKTCCIDALKAGRGSGGHAKRVSRVNQTT